MKNKDRVVIKDYFLSVLCSSGVGVLILMVFIPILLYTLGHQLGNEVTLFSISFSGTLESFVVIEAITHIVLGALVLQYMRLYMFMGLTRERAFLKMVMVEALTLLLTFIVFLIVGSISDLVSHDFALSILLSKCLSYTFACVLMFGIGCVSSAISTTCRPPLSVGVIALFLIFMSWLFEKVTYMIDKTSMEEMVSLSFHYSYINTDVIMAFVFGIVMTAMAFGVYKLPISQMKSTSIS